jgi:hypothetical protein
MTTIVLAHPTEQCPRFRVFGVYDSSGQHRTFAVQEIAGRKEAERVAQKLMEFTMPIIFGGQSEPA